MDATRAGLGLAACAATVLTFTEPARAPKASAVSAPTVTAVGTELRLEGRPFRVFGFNYHCGDEHPNVDYLAAPSAKRLRRLRADFAEAVALGANTVRIFVPVRVIMRSADRPRASAVRALRQTLATARRAGLLVDVTGGLVWEPGRVPAWYESLDEAGRWAVDEAFWRIVAEVGARADNVLAYELTSEPLIGDTDTWYGGEFGNHHYIRVLVRDLDDRDPVALARAWTQRMRDAVRAADRRHMITIGLLPFTGHAFDPANVADLLDFVTLHEYPVLDDVDRSVAIVRHFASQGRPLLLGETFGMEREAVEEFLTAARRWLDGTLSFYDGRAPDEATADDETTTQYRENLISYLGLRATLGASPAPFARIP